ncbi:uncharacterized protein VTP21DRAFT_9195 [Calcarisporiella thermophila]|uniref:uncharacterized protein n=1 Tax=Calcarisporiella thermophila TaxID=911321 RepID=UPI0037425335
MRLPSCVLASLLLLHSLGGSHAQSATTPSAPAPSFPAAIITCLQCEQNYSTFHTCMEKSSQLANITSIADAPKILDVAKCLCSPSFLGVYSQCLKCFQETGQIQQQLGTLPFNVSDFVNGCNAVTGVLEPVTSIISSVGGNKPTVPTKLRKRRLEIESLDALQSKRGRRRRAREN